MKKTAQLIALRAELSVSGEAATGRFLCEVLSGRLVRRSRLELFRAWLGLADGPVIIKLPTIAQISWVAPLILTSRRSKWVLWVDGLLWERVPPLVQRMCWREELPLTLARALMNRSFWLHWLKFFPKMSKGRVSIVVASQEQLVEVKQYALPGALSEVDLHVIPNGTPREASVESKRTSSLRVGYLGHSYTVKGISLLLDALKLAQVDGAHTSLKVDFLLSGHGSSEVADQIRRQGFEVREGPANVDEFLGSLDLLVLPLLTDRGTQVFPNVLLEAMRLGLPVLASDLPIIREALGDLAQQLCIPAGDVTAWAQRFRNIAELEKCADMRMAVRARFDEHFSRERIQGLWLDCLEFDQ